MGPRSPVPRTRRTPHRALQRHPHPGPARAVAPGFVLTELTQGLSEDLKQQIVDRTPLGRFATTEEIAYAVSFLASDEAAYITGQVLAVDGGLVMM